MRQRRLKNEINVVPYIDVMLVLLVIFMVTAPMMTPSSIDVPSVKRESSGQAPAKAIEISVETDSKLSLKVDGKTTAFSSRDALIRALKEAHLKNPDAPVAISGAKDIKYNEIITLTDDLRGVGISKIALVVSLDNTGKK